MKITGVAHVLPSHAVTNAEVIDDLRRGCSERLPRADVEALVELTEAGFQSAGTSVRYQLGEGQRAYELVVAAGRQALRQASLEPGDIDLVIYASIGRGFIEPATANVFQDLLGLSRATCFDIVDACASWVRAMDIASRFLAPGGPCRNVLILNGEFIGRYAYRYDLASVEEFEHWFPGVTIGDAAAATVLSAAGEDCGFAADFRTWGEQRGLCMIPLANYEDYLGQPTPHGRPLKPMQFTSFGHRILHFGAARLVDHYREAPSFNSISHDIVFGHPASDASIRVIGEAIGTDFDRFVFSHGRFGNTASAGIPLAMSVAQQEGRLKRGDRVLALMASAGLSTALMRFVF